MEKTIEELIAMHLTPMAQAFRQQMDDASMQNVPFAERFGLIVETEYTSRPMNKRQRLLKAAHLARAEANIQDINYDVGRTLNRKQLHELATCNYIVLGSNIFITGATGVGKTYVACALGAEACHHYYKTLYIRLPELFLLLGEAADAMVLRKWLNKFTTPKLLIIDDWLLDDTMGTKEVQWLMEIAQQREDLSTIFCSQVAPSDWYDILNKAGGRVADAIMDRIVNNTYQIAINSMDSEKNISMRALYNPLKTSKA